MNNEILIGPEGQSELLEIARDSVRHAVKGEPSAEPASSNPDLQKKCGAFVTLKSGGRLRGCLGCFHSDEAICKLVNKMAEESATQDPRFVDDRITPEEVDDVEIDISVLSPMWRVQNPLDEIKVGLHGVYVSKGMRSGTFLPQVATEHNMNIEEFLSTCCAHKAGLPPDAWKDDDTDVYAYSAQVIKEETTS